jgi:hypothetical protein
MRNDMRQQNGSLRVDRLDAGWRVRGLVIGLLLCWILGATNELNAQSLTWLGRWGTQVASHAVSPITAARLRAGSLAQMAKTSPFAGLPPMECKTWAHSPTHNQRGKWYLG